MGSLWPCCGGLLFSLEEAPVDTKRLPQGPVIPSARAVHGHASPGPTAPEREFESEQGCSLLPRETRAGLYPGASSLTRDPFVIGVVMRRCRHSASVCVSRSPASPARPPQPAARPCTHACVRRYIDACMHACACARGGRPTANSLICPDLVDRGAACEDEAQSSRSIDS